MVCRAETKAEYEAHMAVIKANNLAMHSYLDAIESPWQLYKVVEKKLQLFGCMSDNVVEQTMGFFRAERFECPLFFIQAVSICSIDCFKRVLVLFFCF
jgi:hypothetical protein